MIQYMYENKIGIALISEPNRIPGGNWIGDANGMAAIHWSIDETCALIGQGKGYVAVESGGFILVSTYCSPNAEKEVFEKLLEDIENNMIIKKRKIIIGEDLNTRAKAWDRRYNARGHIREEWIARKELVVINDGKAETCVRPQGSSMVDGNHGNRGSSKGYKGMGGRCRYGNIVGSQIYKNKNRWKVRRK